MYVHSKLILVYEGIPDLRIAYQKPAYTLQGLITDLHVSVTTYDRTNTNRQEVLVIDRWDDTYFTDCKYYGQGYYNCSSGPYDRYDRNINYLSRYEHRDRPNHDRP